MKIVISSGQVPRDLSRRRVAVGGGEALGQRARLQVVLLRAGGLQGAHRHQVAELGGALEGQAPGDGGQEAGAERVTGPSWVDGLGVGYGGARATAGGA